MFNAGERNPKIKILEEQHRAARNEYIAACRELVRRDKQGTAIAGDARRSNAAVDCAAKKKAYDSSTNKLRAARTGR